jgi:hypothetical protein
MSGKREQWIGFFMLRSLVFNLLVAITLQGCFKWSCFDVFTPRQTDCSIDLNQMRSVVLHLSRFEHAIVIERYTGDPVTINTKSFSRSDLRLIAHFLSGKISDKSAIDTLQKSKPVARAG